MPNLEDVLKDALVLDARERAALAEKLLASLDEQLDDGNLDEAEAERLWARESAAASGGVPRGAHDPCPSPTGARKG
jgi:hypothetical protein